jgi:hypothetical protein
MRVLTIGALNLYIAFMAKQAGDIFIVGTVDDLCFYKMNEKYYVRMKSSLTGKKFWKNKVFEGSRRSALLLGRASKVASAYYKIYPKEKKIKGLFNEITGKVKLWLREGKTEDEISQLLQKYYPVHRKKRKAPKKNERQITEHAKHWHRLFSIPYSLFYNAKNNCLKKYSDSG